MKRLIEFHLNDGGTVVAEVDEPEEGGVLRVARPGEIVSPSHLTFDEAIERIKPATAIIIRSLQTMSEIPSEVEISFGIKFNAEVGAIIAASGGDANYTITIRWNRET